MPVKPSLLNVHPLRSPGVLGLLGLLGMLGCVAPEATDTAFEPASAPTCEIRVESTWPVDGSTSAYFRDPIEFLFSEAVDSAEIDAPVAGTSTLVDDGTLVRFVPDAPLDPNTLYSFGLDYCGGSPSVSFTTSAHGAPLADSSLLVGAAFATNIGEARWTIGGGVGAVLASVLDRSVLVAVTAAAVDSMDVRVAVGEQGGGDAQDECARTVDVPDIGLVDGTSFTLQTSSLAWDAWDASIEPTDVLLSGTFAPDLSGVGGLSLSAVVDMRDLVTSLGLASADLVCELVDTIDAQCAPCAIDGESYCVALAGDRFEAWAVDEDLVEVTTVADSCAD
jgi:hypothetical protein